MCCRLLTGKTARTSRVGLDGLGPKLSGAEELGKRLRRRKRARVASPQPDSRSQSNSNGTPKKITVRPLSTICATLAAHAPYVLLAILY